MASGTGKGSGSCRVSWNAELLQSVRTTSKPNTARTEVKTVPEITRETCVQKYEELKLLTKGSIPKRGEFLKFAGIHNRKLGRLFGKDAYTELQKAAGDTPNKLPFERTPTATIMTQFASLVTELKRLPVYPDWDHRGFSPTDSGLSQSHGIKWTEFPTKFLEWVRSTNATGFDDAIQIIEAVTPKNRRTSESNDDDFSRLINDVRSWIPARRRNNEETYKVELRKHLESIKYLMNEEVGDSKCDLVVSGKFAIEIKKDPDQSEYDRLFGQVARHLEAHRKVIVLIIEATRKDKLDAFTSIIDKYLNIGNAVVEVIPR